MRLRVVPYIRVRLADDAAMYALRPIVCERNPDNSATITAQGLRDPNKVGEIVEKLRKLHYVESVEILPEQ